MIHVLVIDDDEHMRRLIRRMLERGGHQVTEAQNGDQGLEAFARHGADLAIVDLYMPEKGGWETIRALQRVAPGLPFIIVSGGGALEGLKRGTPGTLDAVRGVATFEVLRKPFTYQALTNAVGALLPAAKPTTATTR